MSNFQELETTLTLSKANVEKLVSYIYSVQQASLNELYTFFNAIHFNLQKVDDRVEMSNMIEEFRLKGVVPDAEGVLVKFCTEYARNFDCVEMVLGKLVKDGGLVAPTQVTVNKSDPSSAGQIAFEDQFTGQYVAVDTSTGVVDHAVRRGDKSVEIAKSSWLSKALYQFISTHSFGDNETAHQRYRGDDMKGFTCKSLS